jgi:2-polyprenyl-3-methyl-5-hydroxy-6-metoxy-1,4-benzoquinol methylase
MDKVTTNDVRAYWEAHPLSSEAIASEPGTPDFFRAHDKMRIESEPLDVQARLYEWDRYAGKRLLDIGCGTGYVAKLYASGGADVTAVDIADKSVELTKKRLALHGLAAEVRQANAEQLPFEASSFDVVTSFGVLHHTPDTARALREVHRVLKPGGITHLMFYNRNSFAYRVLFPLKRVLQPAWRGRTAQDQVNAVDGATNPLGKVFTRDDLIALMPGFADFRFATWELFFHHANKIPKSVRDLMASRWGWFLYVKARKR